MSPNRLSLDDWSIVLSCEHASQRIPSAFRRLIANEKLDTHESYDIGAKDLTQLIAEELGIRPHYGNISRLLIDLNRSLEHPRSHHRHLNKQDLQAFIKEEYEPFRSAVRKNIASLKSKSKRKIILHLSIHSFTRHYKNKRRKTDIGILYDPGRWRELEIALRLQKSLRTQIPLAIHRNRPYWGSTDGHTAWLRQRFSPSNYLGLEIEVCNDLLGRRSRKSIAKAICQALRSLADDAFTP